MAYSPLRPANGEVQGQGYIGRALGYADVLATAFSHAMTYRPEDPEWEGRDRFLLSHGHYAIAYYAALLEAGIIPEAELETYGSDDSRLPMSGMATYTRDGDVRRLAGAGTVHCRRHGAWAAAETEQGTGLQLHVRWGAGRRVDREAAMSAAHYGLSNLINLVDVNKQQADGDSRKILGFEPLQDKWAAFGWYVQRVDGNDLPAVMAAFDNAKSYSGNQPRVILCDTLMGKGVPFLETRDKTILFASMPTNGKSDRGAGR